jgi:hypothetical protein
MNMKADKDEARLSILEKVESGEISIEDAEADLAQILGQAGTSAEAAEQVEVEEQEDENTDNHEDELPILEDTEIGEVDDAEVELAPMLEDPEPSVEVIQPIKTEKHENVYIPTRREQKLAQAERFQNWNSQMMMGTKDSWQLPWPDKEWQWTWQNFGYPVYISHSINVAGESRLQVVLYEGDLFINGWDEPTLKIQGAALDVRTGQDENAIRVASSTGQLQLWLPSSITHVEAKVILGDVWLRNISADIDTHCQSGDLGCEQIKGSVKAQVNGGDTRLMGIEGSIDVDVIRGNSDVRDISSDSVSLKSTEGNIWLSLDSVSSGKFHCENSGGDINLLTKGELACELLLEATEGGQISPVILPWQQLLERSATKLHGVLSGGGAFVNLSTRGGSIYIQESWMSASPVPFLNS